jgi:Protein of unknown function (DUF3551)
MRLILAGLAAAAAIFTANVETASAQAANPHRPYCLRDGVNGPGMWDCSYYSMDQCRATAHGNGGSCQPNPWYVGPRRR